ncbi:hypothetical protein UPYG_G00339830 [Umbra pygmaea]|uniref:Ig-like domain-containing protein n=1 Tax=Umbra pygmaea TaxID=75934 RepID=A0ABD0WD31_UMBPY
MGLFLNIFTTLLLKGALCQQWKLWAPASIDAVGESCVLVPCRFEIPADYEVHLNTCVPTGVWKTNDILGITIFSSAQKDAQNKIKGQIVGDLLKKNCTTIFNSLKAGDGGTFIFRIECTGTNVLKYNFIETVKITHTDAPPKPQLIPMSNITVGDKLRLRCSAPAPCHTLPPSLTWNSDHGGFVESELQEKGEDGLTTVSSTLVLHPTPINDRKTVSCSALYQLQPVGAYKKTQTNLTLNVLYAPINTVVLSTPFGPVSEGIEKTLTCQSDANPPVEKYSWYKDIGGQLTWMANGQILVLQFSKSDTGLYRCEAYNQKGSQMSDALRLDLESCQWSTMNIFIISGVSALLCILNIAVNVYIFKRLSRQLNQVVLWMRQSDNTYTTLRLSNISHEYDQLQMTTAPPSEARK